MSFPKKLKEVGDWYQPLDTDDQVDTLQELVSLSRGQTLHQISAHLHTLLYRDFIKQLPAELSAYILRLLDPPSLLSCTQVNREWRAIVLSCTGAWRLACSTTGLPLDKIQHQKKDAVYYRQQYQLVKRQLEKLADPKLSVDKLLLQGHTQRVMALHYNECKIATGSDDGTVRIWRTEDGCWERTLHVQHAVASVVHTGSYIVAGAYDASITSWDPQTGKNIQRFTGHKQAVTALDYSTDQQILVSGSHDGSVKLWRMSSGELFTTLMTPSDNDSEPCGPSSVSHVVAVRVIPPQHKSAPYYIVAQNGCTIVRWTICSNMHIPLCTRRLTCVNKKVERLLPRFHLQGNTLSWATCRMHACRIYQCHVNSDVDVLTPVVTYQCGQRTFPHGLLGAGKCFAAVTMVGERAGVDIVHMSSSRRISFVSFPDDRVPSVYGSNCCLGRADWLDGLDEENAKGLLFSTSLLVTDVLLYGWK